MNRFGLGNGRVKMMQVAIVAFLTLCGIVSLHAQRPLQDCKDLLIKASDSQLPWYSFEASLELSEKERANIRDVRWTITKHNTTANKKEVETVNDSLSVTTKAWNANEGGYITWLVVARIGDCIAGGVVSSLVTPNPGTPILIDEFGDLPVNDEKARLDSAIAEMKRRDRNEELIVFTEFNAKTPWKARQGKVKAMLDHIVAFRNFDPRRVTIVLSEGSETSFRLQSVPARAIDIVAGNETMTIPVERFNDFLKFFK